MRTRVPGAVVRSAAWSRVRGSRSAVDPDRISPANYTRQERGTTRHHQPLGPELTLGLNVFLHTFRHRHRHRYPYRTAVPVGSYLHASRVNPYVCVRGVRVHTG